MIVCYLDSSAWVKRYIAESGSQFVRTLFSGDTYALACSSLGPVELTAALARKRKAGEISEARALRLRNRLHRDWLRFYRLPVLEPVIDLAMRLADEHSLRGADAVHLASAVLLREYLRSRADELIWVSSDRELNFAAEGLGFSTADPMEHA